MTQSIFFFRFNHLVETWLSPVVEINFIIHICWYKTKHKLIFPPSITYLLLLDCIMCYENGGKLSSIAFYR